MKNFRNISKKLMAGISAVCLLSVTLSSCLKGHESDTPAPPVALLSVIQSSPGQPALDFSLDGTRVNLNPLNYGDDLDYFRAYAGKRTVAFSKNGASSTIISDTLTLSQNLAYSLFLVNKVSTPQLFVLKDSLTMPSSGSANLRFINLSPDAPAVDLAITGGAVLVSKRAFKGYSSFAPIAGKTYSFEIRKAGTTTVLTTLNNVYITPGFVYTIWFHGLSAATDATKLKADLITNARPY